MAKRTQPARRRASDPGAIVRTAFGSRVRELRLERGLTQESLAEFAGLHRNYVGSLERGERNVSIENVHALAKALGVPASALFVSGK